MDSMSATVPAPIGVAERQVRLAGLRRRMEAAGVEAVLLQGNGWPGSGAVVSSAGRSKPERVGAGSRDGPEGPAASNEVGSSGRPGGSTGTGISSTGAANVAAAAPVAGSPAGVAVEGHRGVKHSVAGSPAAEAKATGPRAMDAGSRSSSAA